MYIASITPPNFIALIGVCVDCAEKQDEILEDSRVVLGFNFAPLLYFALMSCHVILGSNPRLTRNVRLIKFVLK